MLLTRSEFLAGAAGSVLRLLFQEAGPGGPRRSPMGIGMHSYGFRRFGDPFAFLEHARSLGAGGVQTAVGSRDDAFCDRLRAKLEEDKLYLEGSIALPRKESELERFAQEVRTLQRCGASVFRTVLTNGRRYEAFDTAEAFRGFLEQAKQALSWVRPVLEKHSVRMAVENHKDLRAVELLDLITLDESPFIGICVDTGNNIALLETPQETVELLAPHALSTHIKDMGVEEYIDGFLLSEVPLGTGVQDLTKIIASLRKARPDIRLNLEMMTRDPLKVPCFLQKFLATMKEVPFERLTEMLRWIRANAAKSPLPRVSALSAEEQQARENDNVKQCLRYDREHLEG